MKIRIRALALCLALLMLSCALTSCENYKLRKSSEKEATPVLQLGEHTVNFEVLYTFFLNACERREEYNDTYFTGAGWEERFDEVMEEALAQVAEIYGLFALCKEVGIDPFGEEMDTSIMNYLKTTVGGGAMGEHAIVGFDSYSEYLDYIREHYHMNDAVNRLMIRYALCEEELMEYYQNTHRFTEDDVRAFFKSADCIRVVWVGRPKNASFLGLTEDENRELLETAKKHLENGKIDLAIQLSLEPSTDFYMGRYTKDSAYYAELIETAYQLSEDETSDIIELGAEGYYIVKRLKKLSSHFESRYAEIEEVYLYDLQCATVLEKAEALLEGIVYKDAFATLTPSDFRP